MHLALSEVAPTLRVKEFSGQCADSHVLGRFPIGFESIASPASVMGKHTFGYIFRPSSPFDRYQTRRSTLVQILPLHGLLENTQTGISHTEETQTAPRVVAVDTDQRMLNLLKGDTGW